MSVNGRCRRVLAEMERAGLDAVIAVCGDVHGFQTPNAVMLLSGFRSTGDSYVVLRKDGETTLVVSPAWEADRAAARSYTMHNDATNDIRSSLTASIEQLALPNARVGIVGLYTLGYANALWLMQMLRGRGHRFDFEFLAATRQKSASEIANAERATHIALQGYDLLLSLARPGISEINLATELCSAMAAAGADDNFLMLSAGRHNRAVRSPGSHVLEEGDIILSEVSPSFDGQFSQICRTTVIGRAPQPVVEKYVLLQESFRRGMKAAVPGARVTDLVAAINANLIEAGYGEFCVPPHMRARGHGLGFGSIDPGDLSANSQSVIERDMVFVIHPNQYMPETGYMMCGDPVVVTETGARNLAARPAALDQLVPSD
jgi:Xaa-Pro dipeptidase